MVPNLLIASEPLPPRPPPPPPPPPTKTTIEKTLPYEGYRDSCLLFNLFVCLVGVVLKQIVVMLFSYDPVCSPCKLPKGSI